ncbi:MAG: hypothetical protein MH321_18295 [Leptospiraceae bacterium]|nr:hypothetical protein [Leptospiraceae bacterium]
MLDRIQIFLIIFILGLGITQCSKEEPNENDATSVIITEDNADEEMEKLLKEIEAL